MEAYKGEKLRGVFMRAKRGVGDRGKIKDGMKWERMKCKGFGRMKCKGLL